MKWSATSKWRDGKRQPAGRDVPLRRAAWGCDGVAREPAPSARRAEALRRRRGKSPSRNWTRTVRGLLASWILLSGWIATAADAATGMVRQWPAKAVIRFAGTSTLHDFEGTLPEQAFTLVVSNGLWSAEAKVPTARMSTDHAKRDRKMMDMMQAEAHPLLAGRVVDAAVPGNGATSGKAVVALQIRDRRIELPVEITGWEETADRIRFRAAWELSLKAYGLQPPSVLGMIRVGDRVRLEADVTATGKKE